MSNYYHNEDYSKGYENGWEDGSQRKTGYANASFLIGCCVGTVVPLLILSIAAAIK